MIQESRGNVFCFEHGCPLSECTDECEIKKGAKEKMDQVNALDSRAKVLRLPQVDERAVMQAQVDASVKEALDRHKADLARLAEVRERARARQEELLAEAEKEAPESDPEEPKKE